MKHFAFIAISLAGLPLFSQNAFLLPALPAPEVCSAIPGCIPNSQLSGTYLIWATGKTDKTRALEYTLQYADSNQINHSLSGVFVAQGTRQAVSNPLALGESISVISLTVTDLVVAQENIDSTQSMR